MLQLIARRIRSGIGRIALGRHASPAVFGLFVGLVLLASASAPAQVRTPAPVLRVDGLGKGAVPLDGPWQFHLGDDAAWADPNLNDAAGQNGWEQLTADEPWGLQGHDSTMGYAWYRKHIDLNLAPGAPPDIAMMVPGIDDIYQFYWNGKPVAGMGSFPPHLDGMQQVPPQTYGLGPVRKGVLAVRVFKVPFASNDPGALGGFEGPPILGSPAAIRALRDADDYQWLRQQQFGFGLTSLYALASLLSFIAWLRDRRQKLLLWMTLFTFMPIAEIFLQGMRLEFSFRWIIFLTQITIQVREVAQWFVLFWLLKMDDMPKLARQLRWLAFITTPAGALDGVLPFLYPRALNAIQMQLMDAALTVLISLPEAVPVFLVLVAIFRRKKLDSARWVVASLALIGGVYYGVYNCAAQGVRFTHWTLSERMHACRVVLFGSTIQVQTACRALLFLSIVYAVIRWAAEDRRRRIVLEQEFQAARELQRVLVPEQLPEIPGFRFTSAYCPAREVGGDFFQVVALEGGSTLVVLGDVSGKGLRAAMTVSLIVGALRTLAECTSNPADLLARLNRHLVGRLQGGFVTCIAARIDPNGACVFSSAGHPGPFLGGRELPLPGALPVGLVTDAVYEEVVVDLNSVESFVLYTDGLLEARNPAGEIYGFDRLHALFASHPTAASASEAAVAFGQEDDITVLTLERAVPA